MVNWLALKKDICGQKYIEKDYIFIKGVVSLKIFIQIFLKNAYKKCNLFWDD